MDPDKHRAAVTALTDLIRSVLESDDRDRLARVGRLVKLTQKLELEGAMRMTDVDAALDDGDGMIGGNIVGQYQYGALRAPAPLDDTARMMREVLALMEPTFSRQRDQATANTKKAFAIELNELLEARGRITELRENHFSPEEAESLKEASEAITKRLRIVTAELEKEDPHAALVPALDVRGRETHASDAGDDAPHPDGPFPYGTGGSAIAPLPRL